MLHYIVAELRAEVSTLISSIKSDVSDCNNRIAQVETFTSSRVSMLEIENNSLHRKFNRSDVIIRGLPAGLDDLGAIATGLATYYKVPSNPYIVNHACYINNKQIVLGGV